MRLKKIQSSYFALTLEVSLCMQVRAHLDCVITAKFSLLAFIRESVLDFLLLCVER